MNNWQRDPRWANIKIDDLTIGQVGCTSSVAGNIIGVTPDVFVARMKAVGGFLGNLIIWAKIEEAFPGIKIKRVWSYDNTDVKNNVPNVIVEVPAAPIGGTGSHWVQYLGNQRLNDPWTGKERPTSDFPGPTGYCVITGAWDKPADTQAIIDELRTARDDNWNKYQTEVSVNNDLTKQLQDEQKKSQDLRVILDKQTAADADTGAQLLDAQHKTNDYKGFLDSVCKALDLPTPQEYTGVDLVAIEKRIDALKAPIEEQMKPLAKHAESIIKELPSLEKKRSSKKDKNLIQRIGDFLSNLWH